MKKVASYFKGVGRRAKVLGLLLVGSPLAAAELESTYPTELYNFIEKLKQLLTDKQLLAGVATIMLVIVGLVFLFGGRAAARLLVYTIVGIALMVAAASIISYLFSVK